MDHTTPSRPWVSGFRHHSGPCDDGTDSLHSLSYCTSQAMGSALLVAVLEALTHASANRNPEVKTFTLLRPVTIVLRWSESCRGKIWSDTVSVRTAETPFSSSKCLVLCSLVENYVLITIILGRLLPLVPVNCVSPLSPRSSSFLVHEPPGSFLFPQARTPWRCLCNGFV